MRSWKELLATLTREPRGFNADGRMIGLGLHAAQRESEQQATAEVETYLRDVTARREPLTK
ncbi:MAG: hypothetical protein GEU97_09060 [Actinophytocola sp.]|nr:hypothetical protein [Actinophytocola sp.]